ncbi:unnamed protein product [Mytilus coruscus]|uniref:Uncharacterized protein n=1 Tax=Mytilus coruscus TaxID=42192 RepID=A0A6J8D1T1_MYTCO|nr:unnamed protein product [Mytilus coruscus]
MPGMNPATERRSARVKERVSVTKTKSRPDREPSRKSTMTANTATSINSNDDIRTSIDTLSKAVSRLKDHHTSVSDTVKTLKEQSDSTLENQQHITVQADVMDQPPIHQTCTAATVTEQTQNDNSNGTISRLGTNNSNYDSPSYLENVTFTQTTCNNTFQPALPVGTGVSDDIKGKIWANEYINLIFYYQKTTWLTNQFHSQWKEIIKIAHV